MVVAVVVDVISKCTYFIFGVVSSTSKHFPVAPLLAQTPQVVYPSFVHVVVYKASREASDITVLSIVKLLIAP